MLIELARVLKARPHEFTYELVWLDGEEAVCRTGTSAASRAPDNTYGSRYYVAGREEGGTRSARSRPMILST